MDVEVTGHRRVGDLKEQDPEGFLATLARPEGWTAAAYAEHYQQGKTVHDDAVQILFKQAAARE